MVNLLFFLTLFLPGIFCFGTEKIEKDFHSNGSIKTESIYTSSDEYKIREFSDLGFLIKEASYKNKKLHGKSFFYTDSGKPLKVIFYENGIQTQKIEYSELYKKADNYLADHDNILKAKNIHKKLEPFILRLIDNKLRIAIGLLLFGIVYFIFKFHRPDHKTYFKYTKAVTHFSLESELLSAPPRIVELSSLFFTQLFCFLFTIGFSFYVSTIYPKAILLTIGVSLFGLYLFYKAYEKIQILKYGLLVEAEIKEVHYIRRIGKAKIILLLSYDRNDNVYRLQCNIPMPKEPVSNGDHLSLLIDPMNPNKFLIYKFSTYKVKKAA